MGCIVVGVDLVYKIGCICNRGCILVDIEVEIEVWDISLFNYFVFCDF